MTRQTDVERIAQDVAQLCLTDGQSSTDQLDELVQEGAVSVNRATLVLPVVENSTSSLFPPTNRLHILYRTTSGDLQLTEDILQGGPELFGGTFDPEEGNYRMRITRHVQAMLNGEVEADHFFVNTSIPLLEEGAANTVSRVALKGPASSDPPRLEVIYTEY